MLSGASLLAVAALLGGFVIVHVAGLVTVEDGDADDGFFFCFEFLVVDDVYFDDEG